MNTEPNEATEPRPTLMRALGAWSATAVVIGIVIGSGIFKKPQTVAENVPTFGLTALVWVLGGLAAFLGAVAYAEVAVLFPRTGGNYVFLREAYGLWAGFLWGWAEFWIIRSASIAALATIFTQSLDDVMRGAAGRAMGFWPQTGATAAVIAGLALVNVRGVRWGAGLQFAITTVKVGSLLGILVLPFALAAPDSDAPPPRMANLLPLWPGSFAEFDMSRLCTALLGVLWAYHGWMGIAPLAGEVRDPQRTLPRALLLGTSAVVALYLGANLAYHLVLPREQIAAVQGTTVATAFTERLLGPLGAVVASAAVMFSTFGALNGNLLAGPRLLYAMGEDRLAPRALTAVHARYHTPAAAILTMAGFSMILVLSAAALTHAGVLSESKSNFDRLTDLAMFGSLTFETLAVASIYVFRRTLPDADRPYRCRGYPYVPAAYILIMGVVLTYMFLNQSTEALIGIGFIAVGAAAYQIVRPRGAALRPG